MLENYTWFQWITFFFIYAFAGWCWEVFYVSVRKKTWVNRGFLFGPFLPLYGFGFITVLLVGIRVKENLLLLYVASAVAATLLEYVTGLLMEFLFRVRYWDYTERKWNIKGYVCPAATFLWGFFGVVAVRVIHPFVESKIALVPRNLMIFIISFIIVFEGIDFANALHAAIDLRILLDKLQSIQKEAARLQKRMDVLVAVVTDELEPFEKIEEAKEELVKIRGLMGEYSKSAWERVGKAPMWLLKRNPSAVSAKYHEILEEVKQKLRK